MRKLPHDGNLCRKRQLFTKMPGYMLGGSPYTEAHHIALVKSKAATPGNVAILFRSRYARKVTA